MKNITLIFFILSVAVSYSKSVYCDTVFYFKVNIHNVIPDSTQSKSLYKLHFASNDSLFVNNYYPYKLDFVSKVEYLKVDSIFNSKFYFDKSYQLKEIFRCIENCQFVDNVSLKILLKSYWMYMYNSAKNDSIYIDDSIAKKIFGNKSFWKEYDYQKSIKFYVASLIKFNKLNQKDFELVHKNVKDKLIQNLSEIELDIAQGYLYEIIYEELDDAQKANMISEISKIQTKILREYILKIYTPINYDESISCLKKYIQNIDQKIKLQSTIVIYFWGDWCYYSKEEFKNIENLDNIILFNLTANVNDSIKTTLLTKLTAKDKTNNDIIEMYESEISKQFNVYSLPQWIVIDNKKRKVTNYGSTFPEVLE